jgi:hypothetical protein
VGPDDAAGVGAIANELLARVGELS